MNAIVIYKSKYGSTKKYAQWIAEEFECSAEDVKNVKISDLMNYECIIYGGGLYAEIISGASLITKNYEALRNKKLVFFTTGLTPIECREYYEKYVAEKNFKPEMLKNIKIFNFLGKMKVSELSIPHKAAIKMLKKVMSAKENPTELEKMLVKLCDSDGDFSDRSSINPLIEYVKNKNQKA